MAAYHTSNPQKSKMLFAFQILESRITLDRLHVHAIFSLYFSRYTGGIHVPLLLGHWYEIMALYYVKSILTEISASRQDRRVLQKSKIIRIEFLSKWGMLQTSRYV